MEEPKRVVQIGWSEEAHQEMCQKGVYFLCGEVDDEMAYDFTIEMTVALARGHLKQPITIILNTPGGEIQQGLAIYDTIRMLVRAGVEVHIVGIGLVASMGTVIMQAASRRFSLPSTQFLVHQLSMTIGFFKSEEVTEIKARAGEADRLNNIVMGIIAERSGIELEQLKTRCSQKDLWLDAEAATKLGGYGLIDEIVSVPEQFYRFMKPSSQP